jgi:hypothetical protein
MTTKKNLVKSMFMNILTAGVFSFGFVFTACTSDDVLLNENPVDNSQEIKAVDGEGIKRPVGLVYKDFITSNDVQILNADTTEIAVSKALADKLKIKDFVSRPMGIWQSLDERAYLRRATAQKLVGDKYILTVVRSGLGEVLMGQDYELSTSIFVNPNAGTTRGADGSTDKYTDANNVLHPAAVTINSMVDANGQITRGADGRGFGTLTAEQIMAGETFDGANTRGFLSDIYNAIKRAVTFIDNVRKNGLTINGEDHGKVLNLNGTITPPDIHATFGTGKGDTLNIKSKVPYNISLDYFLKLNSKVKIKSAWQMWDEWTLNPIDFKCNYFEGRLDGEFSVAPQMTIGVGGKAELPEDMQDHKICDLQQITFTFMAGCVPVAIVVQPHLDLHVNVGVGGKIYTGVKYEYASEFSVGMKYQNGWKPITRYETTKNEFSFIKPTGSFSAEAEAGVTLGCDVMIDGLVGPTLSVGPMFKAGLEGKVAPFDKVPFTFEAAVTAGIYGKAGAKLKLWKIDLLKAEADFNFGPEWEIWSYKYPNGNNKGGNNKLLQLVEEMRQQALSEIEAKTSQAFNEITH